MMQQFIKGIDSSLVMNLFSENKFNSLQEINLRLLVLTIQWIKNMPLFIRLDNNDQVIILKNFNHFFLFMKNLIKKTN